MTSTRVSCPSWCHPQSCSAHAMSQSGQHRSEPIAVKVGERVVASVYVSQRPGLAAGVAFASAVTLFPLEAAEEITAAWRAATALLRDAVPSRRGAR